MGDLDLGPMLHALGLDQWHAVPYRNHYVTSAEDPEIAPLVTEGLMVEVPAPAFLPPGSRVFLATDAGKRAALAEHKRRYPPPPKARARYLHWLDIADVCDVKFGEYLRRRMYAQGSGPG